MLINRYDCHERIDALSLSNLYIPASNLPRTGWVIWGIRNPETIAQHQMDAALLVEYFRREIEGLGADILRIQDTLLIHDLAEPDPRVGDITPHCTVSPLEKRRLEDMVIREMLYDNPYALKLWMDYEDGRTIEGKLSKEFDQLQAILKARYYEDTEGKVGVTEEFHTYSVIRKGHISTNFLLHCANECVTR